MISVIISVFQPPLNANELWGPWENFKYLINAVLKEIRNFLLHNFPEISQSFSEIYSKVF